MSMTRRNWLAGMAAAVSVPSASLLGTMRARANTLDDAFNVFTSEILINLPVPPSPDTLDGYIPDLSRLARDNLRIINQVQEDGSLDGGDSVHRTGVASFCNSALDKDLLSLFEKDGLMVRHPTQAPWNNWKNCTRDQLMGYTAGCWRAKRFAINQRLLMKHAMRIPPFTCQDTEEKEPGSTKNIPIGDPLAPHEVMYLRVCAGDYAAAADAAGQFLLQLAAQTAGTNRSVDKTNLLLMCIVCGRLNLFVQVIPNWEATLRYYWSGWRQQPQIAEALISVVHEELLRYPPSPASLLPHHLLALLRSLDFKAELQSFDPAHHAQLGIKFAEAALRDAADTFTHTLHASLNDGVAQLKQLGADPQQIAYVFAASGQKPDAISAALKSSGLPVPDLFPKFIPTEVPKSWNLPAVLPSDLTPSPIPSPVPSTGQTSSPIPSTIPSPLPSTVPSPVPPNPIPVPVPPTVTLPKILGFY